MNDDTISRQAAIDAIEKAMCEDGFRSSTGLIHKTTAYEVIRHLPSAQPERKRGHWIEVDDDLIRGKCSVCGWEAHLYEDDVVGMDFCPNCGADMRGDSNG